MHLISSTGFSKILVDTGSPNIPEYITNLQQTLKNHNATIKEIVITHWHEDHVGGVPNVCKEVLRGMNHMSRVMGKPVFGLSQQVRHKLGCTNKKMARGSKFQI